MICGSGGSTSRLAKAAGAEPFGQMRNEKLHAVVARSTFRSQNVQNTPGPDHFWKLMSKKCTPLWREADFEVKMYKALDVRATFGGSDVVLRFAAFPETMAGVGHLKRIFKDAFRMAGAVQKTCSSELLYTVRRSGR